MRARNQAADRRERAASRARGAMLRESSVRPVVDLYHGIEARVDRFLSGERLARGNDRQGIAGGRTARRRACSRRTASWDASPRSAHFRAPWCSRRDYTSRIPAVVRRGRWWGIARGNLGSVRPRVRSAGRAAAHRRRRRDRRGAVVPFRRPDRDGDGDRARRHDALSNRRPAHVCRSRCARSRCRRPAVSHTLRRSSGRRGTSRRRGCWQRSVAQATFVHFLAIRSVVPSFVLVVVDVVCRFVSTRAAPQSTAFSPAFAKTHSLRRRGPHGRSRRPRSRLSPSRLSRGFFADSIPLVTGITIVATLLRALLFWIVMALDGYPPGLGAMHFPRGALPGRAQRRRHRCGNARRAPFRGTRAMTRRRACRAKCRGGFRSWRLVAFCAFLALSLPRASGAACSNCSLSTATAYRAAAQANQIRLIPGRCAARNDLRPAWGRSSRAAVHRSWSDSFPRR